MIPTQTLNRVIRTEERKHPGATGELSELLSAIALGVKYIGQLVSTAGFKGLHGYTTQTNVQGETVHKIDEESDNILVELLGSTGHFGLLVSEEREQVVAAELGRDTGKYVVAFDPLDGSSNLGSNIPVGTIFTIFRKKELGRAACTDDFFQSGRAIVAAGYAVYGARTTFVYSAGHGVHGFTLDPSIGEFLLTDPDMKFPNRGAIYSTNEGNMSKWTSDVTRFIELLKSEDKSKGTPYTARYAGSLVADFDRNLKKGGIFLYPWDSKNPRGKLRLLYEVMPLSFIAVQAGGRAVDGKRDIMDITPTDIHERCPFIVGSTMEVDWFEEVLQRG